MRHPIPLTLLCVGCVSALPDAATNPAAPNLAAAEAAVASPSTPPEGMTNLLPSPDTDGDGISNAEELANGWNPRRADTDRDGLNDGDELAAGADPLLPDTDGDRLLDSVEVNLGTSPVLADTDGDGWSDREERDDRTDPLDPSDFFTYIGGYPALPDAVKDAITPATPARFPVRIGEQFPRVIRTDAFGQPVDLYDFALGGRPIIMVLHAAWSPPDRDLAAWLAGRPNLIYDNVYGPDLPEAIANGDVALISVVVEDPSAAPATQRTVREWENRFGVPGNPVLRDNREELEVITGLTFWPWLAVLDETMTVRDDGFAYAGMLALTPP
jgi:hypothetical protein